MLGTRCLVCSAMALALAGFGCDGGGGSRDGGVAPGRDGGPPLRCSYPELIGDQVALTLDTGDALQAADADALITAELDLIEHHRSAFDPDLAVLYGLQPDGTAREDGSSLTAVSWDPRHDAALLSATFGVNTLAMVSNDDADGSADPEARGLAVIGRAGGTPYMVLATNPFRTNPDRGNSSVVDEAMDDWLENAVFWLTHGGEAPLSAVLSQLDESHWFEDESSTRAWLDAHVAGGVTYNEAGACDGAALDGCLAEGAELLIISQRYDAEVDDQAAITASVERALEAGTPVLYLQLDGDLNPLGEALLSLLEVSHDGDNYWHDLRATAADGRALLGQLPPNFTRIADTLTRLRSRSYDFTLPSIAEDPDADASYRAQFADGAEAVREILGGLDERGVDHFATCGHEVIKLLALIGDRLRQDVSFPMVTAESETAVFLRSYFADHAVYNRRSIAPAQPDRGNFDAMDLTAVEGQSVTVELTSRPSFRAAGVYLLPGRAATITRLDESAETTAVFVNSLRPGSTALWNDDRYGGYSRPRFLRSASVPLAPGQTITFTNPYGGPLQVAFGGTGERVQLRFEGVGQHPYWRGPEDDALFADRLAEGTYDWVEVATDHFEVHSRRDKFLETMSDPRWDDVAELAADVDRYTWNLTHVMAGFQGAGIDAEPEVHDWATARGLAVPVLDRVKHGNMDQATCGAGCSGNPYDAGWALDPIAHGHLHELGHSLQNDRFQLTYGAQRYGNHAVTNWTPFYVQDRYFGDHGLSGTWSIPHGHIFDELQAAYAAGERSGQFSEAMRAYFEAKIADDEIRDCYALFLQAMAAARHAGALQNGYHIVPRIHVLDRAVDDATGDEAGWLAARDALGFGLFSHAEANAMTDNDFIAVGLSLATGLDFRDFLAMWGVAISQRASDQIATFAYPVVERAFFALGELDHSSGGLSTRAGDIARIVLDGTTEWPLAP